MSEFQFRPERIKFEYEELPFVVRESINVLRGNIQLSGYDMKVIAITSSLAHEGKSSIAFRLALSLAALNLKVIYVDSDIRNSITMSRYHIHGSHAGLSEYLCGMIPLRQAIKMTYDQNLDVILPGGHSPNPSELISGPLFKSMLEKLKEQYDYVIVDTPPINAVIDGAIIAKACDGTVLVVESGITLRAQAIRAKKQLDYAGVKLIGSVLNKVTLEKKRYGYGKYGYGYGYGYG